MKITKNFKEHLILLGKHIQTIRKNKNISLQDLSKKTQIRIEYLKKIEKGEAYGVRIGRHIYNIALSLEVSLYELFDYL